MRRGNRASVRSFRSVASVTQFLGNGILGGGHASLGRFRIAVPDRGFGATGKPDGPVPTTTGQALYTQMVAQAVQAISPGGVHPLAIVIPLT